MTELARICRGRCVVSVPWEPFFRLGNLCRGKDVQAVGQQSGARPTISTFEPPTPAGCSFGQVDIRPCFPWLIGVAAPSPRRRGTLRQRLEGADSCSAMGRHSLLSDFCWGSGPSRPRRDQVDEELSEQSERQQLDSHDFKEDPRYERGMVPDGKTHDMPDEHPDREGPFR